MPTVGEILRNEREKKGLSLKDIEKATSIRSLYLQAIEEDNYQVIPGEVYLKGFIRNYANYLELDGQGMVNLYRETKHPLPAAEPESEQPAINEHVQDEKPAAPSSRRGSPMRVIALTVLAVVILIGGGWWWFTGHDTQQQPQQTKSAPVVPSQPAPQPPAPQAMPSKPVVVVAKYVDTCWTLVTADGKEIYEGIPKVGETLTWEAQSKITIQFGNAGGVDVVYNGQTVGKMGARGEVVTKNFSANTQQ